MSADEYPDFVIPLRRFRDDPELRARVRAEPAGVLEEQGVRLPPETDVRVVEDTAEVCHFVLPQDPNASLSDAALGAVSGGGPVGPVMGDQVLIASTVEPPGWWNGGNPG